jgi:hypothetical protein
VSRCDQLLSQGRSTAGRHSPLGDTIRFGSLKVREARRERVVKAMLLPPAVEVCDRVPPQDHGGRVDGQERAGNHEHERKAPPSPVRLRARHLTVRDQMFVMAHPQLSPTFFDRSASLEK